MSFHASGHTGSGQLIGHYPGRWGIHCRRARPTTMFLPSPLPPALAPAVVSTAGADSAPAVLTTGGASAGGER
jgi:hypothetical protein